MCAGGRERRGGEREREMEEVGERETHEVFERARETDLEAQHADVRRVEGNLRLRDAPAGVRRVPAVLVDAQHVLPLQEREREKEA